jgi:ElaB/YqjD/DUF883 family membrane-anchored ribosome-binding protein
VNFPFLVSHILPCTPQPSVAAFSKQRFHALPHPTSTIKVMSDTFATNAGALDPEAGFSRTPSVGQAANDLRVAAGEKARDLAQQTSDQARALRERAAESVQHLRDAAGEKALAFKAAATEKAESLKLTASEKARELRSAADIQWRETRVKAKELHITTEDYIRQHPTRCVVGALGVGLLIGLIARR